MQTKQRHAEQIKSRYPKIGKSNHHHFEDVMALLRVFKSNKAFSSQIDRGDLHREVKQMINDEDKNNQPAHEHRARRITRGNDFILRVTDRSRSAILRRQLYCGPNVQRDHDKQSEPGWLDQFRIGLQKMAVAIDHFWPQENL